MFNSKFAIAAFIFIFAIAFNSIKAQESSDDMIPGNDNSIIPPQNPTNNAPTIIDESDSSSVPEVDDYDG